MTHDNHTTQQQVDLDNYITSLQRNNKFVKQPILSASYLHLNGYRWGLEIELLHKSLQPITVYMDGCSDIGPVDCKSGNTPSVSSV